MATIVGGCPGHRSRPPPGRRAPLQPALHAPHRRAAGGPAGQPVLVGRAAGDVRAGPPPAHHRDRPGAGAGPGRGVREPPPPGPAAPPAGREAPRGRGRPPQRHHADRRRPEGGRRAGGPLARRGRHPAGRARPRRTGPAAGGHAHHRAAAGRAPARRRDARAASAPDGGPGMDRLSARGALRPGVGLWRALRGDGRGHRRGVPAQVRSAPRALLDGRARRRDRGLDRARADARPPSASSACCWSSPRPGAWAWAGGWSTNASASRARWATGRSRSTPTTRCTPRAICTRRPDSGWSHEEPDETYGRSVRAQTWDLDLRVASRVGASTT